MRVTSAAAMTDAEALFRTRPLPGVQQGLTAAAGGAKTLALVTRRDVYGRVPSEAPVREVRLPPQPGIGGSMSSTVAAAHAGCEMPRRLTGSAGGVQARFFCNAMPWVECTPLRYHCTKIPDVDLCPEAFADGRFPPGCTAADFICIDQSEMQVNPAPTPQARSSLQSSQDDLREWQCHPVALGELRGRALSACRLLATVYGPTRTRCCCWRDWSSMATTGPRSRTTWAQSRR